MGYFSFHAWHMNYLHSIWIYALVLMRRGFEDAAEQPASAMPRRFRPGCEVDDTTACYKRHSFTPALRAPSSSQGHKLTSTNLLRSATGKQETRAAGHAATSLEELLRTCCCSAGGKKLGCDIAKSSEEFAEGLSV